MASFCATETFFDRTVTRIAELDERDGDTPYLRPWETRCGTASRIGAAVLLRADSPVSGRAQDSYFGPTSVRDEGRFGVERE
jgi:hypothetical protein